MSESQQDKERRQRLAELRRNAGHSQESLAEAIQASRSSIYRWERGDAVPHPRQLASWADALGVEVAELNEVLWSGSATVRPMSPEERLDENRAKAVDGLETEDPSIAADLIDLTAHAVDGLTYVNATLRVLGLSDIPPEERSDWRVVVAMSSFQGATSIQTAAPGYALPASFVQAEDDISNDYFFGKRDVILANQLSSALTASGFPFPLYVDDKTVWSRLAEMQADDRALVIEHEGDAYRVDVLIVVGLWSNLLATAIADWSEFPEYQMVGDPAQHETRTIRIASNTGLRIIDLNASDETDEMGGNPAVLVNRRLDGLHLVVAGGATSLSTLRLSELLTSQETWIEMAAQLDGAAQVSGSWLALECPNAARWKDRCRLVGSGAIGELLNHPIVDVYTGESLSTKESSKS